MLVSDADPRRAVATPLGSVRLRYILAILPPSNSSLLHESLQLLHGILERSRCGGGRFRVRLNRVKGRVKPGHWGGVKLGQSMGSKLLDLRGRRGSFATLQSPFYPAARSPGGGGDRAAGGGSGL